MGLIDNHDVRRYTLLDYNWQTKISSLLFTELCAVNGIELIMNIELPYNCNDNITK